MNNNSPFKLSTPGEWEDQTVYVFRGPTIDNQDHQLMMTVDRQLQNDNISAYARDRTNPIVEGLQGVEVLKEEEVTIEDGNPTYEFVCRWMPAEGFSVIKKYVFVFKDKMGFMFNCGFSKKSYKMLSAQIKQVIDSLLPGTYEPYEED